MSEDKEKKNITAKELLFRLGHTGNETEEIPEFKLSADKEKEAAEIFAEVFAEKETVEKETAYENGISADEGEEGTSFSDEDAISAESVEIPFESTSEDELFVPAEEIAEDVSDVADEYAENNGANTDDAFYNEYEQYMNSDGNELSYDEYAPAETYDEYPAEEYTEEYAAEEQPDYGYAESEYDAEGVDEYAQYAQQGEVYESYEGEYADVNSEDIIPDDEFFDEDPLEDELLEEEAAQTEEEPDREAEFINLVEEVTGASDPTELNESDISLMVALGMEDELAKSVGEETATQMTEDYMADQEEWVDRTKRFGPDEYSDPSENARIAEMYKKRNTVATVKMIAAAVLTIVLLVFENLPVIGYQLSGAFDPYVYPVVNVMVNLQIVLVCAAMAWDSIKRGLKNLCKFKFTVDTVPAILLLASVVFSAVTAYNAVPGKEPAMFNFPVALCFTFAAVNEYLTVRREIFSFNIISSRKPKLVMRNLSTRDALLESEAVADMELDSTVADEGDIIKIQETDFVDGYFWRTKNRSGVNDGFVGLAVIISALLTVAVGIYAGISKQSDCITAGYATLTAALPASMLIIGAYPFYRANRRAYENDCTIIGEGSVEEYSGVGVLSFDDVNVFPSSNVKVRNVRLFNNSRIDKVLYYAASVFATTGGPLADVFEVATMETGHSSNVQILETGSGYIEASVNGKNIIFGRAAALSRLGIIIPDDVVSDTSDVPSDCSVMYMIYQRKLVSKMVVNYVIEPDFEYILKQLTGSGMCVCVKTFDPNIDEDMIYRQMRSSSKYSLRVIKYKSTDEITKYAKHAEGGIVSRGTTKALLHTVSACDRIISAQKTGYIIGVLSAIFGAAIVGTMLIAGSFSALYSVYIVLCQLLWLIPALITTRLIVK